MDLEKWKKAAGKVFSKEGSVRIFVVLGLCGVALLAFSSLFDSADRGKSEETAQEPSQARVNEAALERELERIVAAITGESSPTVLVTLENSGKTVYASDEKEDQRDSSLETERNHVILKDSDGGQQALAVTEITPEIKGVVIVSGRAGDPAIREKLTEAVRVALHVSSARVCVTDSG